MDQRTTRRGDLDATAERRERDADAAFARFATGGHADDLALVFDFAAPRLLLIAARLVPGAAEDLVQQVFLEAMQCASRFEPGRPVMPWLTTILARRAANARRARSAGGARAAQDSSELERLADTVDPSESAARRETAASIAAAVRDLPAPYREVVHLRVLSGLRPVEIASALDRPLATVNSQLHRGLARLRSRLPAGIASAGWAVIAMTGLESVRAQVCAAAAHGPIASASPIAASAMGVATMKKTVSALVVLLVLCAGAIVVATAGGDGPSPGAATASPPRAEVPGEASATAAPSTAIENPAPERREAAVARTDDDVRIHGRLVDVHGQPVSGAPVTAATFGPPIDGGARSVMATRTARDGSFALVVGAHEALPDLIYMRIEARPPAAAALTGLAALRMRRDHDLGTVVCVPGVHVRGHVTGYEPDATPAPGQPASLGGKLVWRRVANRDRDERSDGLSVTDSTVATLEAPAADGSAAFATELPLPFGRYELHLDGHDVIAPPLPIEVTADSGPIAITVRRLERATIEGVVVDDAGRPLAAQVMVATGSAALLLFGGSDGVVAGPDGRFVLRRTGREDVEPLEIVATFAGHGSVRQSLRWGDTAARFELPRLAKSIVRVLAADTGEPMLDYGLHAIAAGGGTRGLAALRAMAHHEHGVLESELLVGGGFTLRAEPDPASGYAPSAPEVVDLTGPREIVLRVPRMAEQSVLVVDADDVPITGATVRLVEVPADATLSPAWTIAIPPVSPAGRHATERHRAVTDVDGRALVRGSPQARHGVRVEHAEFARTIVPRLELGLEQPLRVVLRRGATIRGSLRTTTGEVVSGTVHLQGVGSGVHGPGEKLPAQETQPLDGKTRFVARTLGVPLDDGRFTIEHVPTGDFELTLLTKRPGSPFPDSIVVAAVLAVRDGEVRDVAAVIPAACTVAGIVRVDGQPVAGAAVVFDDVGRQMPTAEATTDVDGAYRATVREGGPYRAHVKTADRRSFAVPERVGPLSHGTHTLDLDLQTRAVAWRFVDADRQPVPALVVYPAGVLSGTPTDASGQWSGRVVVGPQHLLVRPRSLLDGSAWDTFVRETVGQPDRFDRVLIELPTIVVAPGEGVDERTVVLPSAWSER